jgi:hypothetical protein
MTSNFERIAWALAALAFLPALTVMSGFLVAAAIAVGILTLFYGTRYGFRVYEQQNLGKKAGRFDVNSTLNGGDDGKDWGRK